VAASATIAKVRREAAGCRRCPLWRDATQTVFGEGPTDAALVLVGEQPGDREDLDGHPFVGPAGGLLDRALEAAGIDRSLTYTTNAVKHFKYRLRGKRRIHQRPAAGEIAACRPWLQSELDLLSPGVVVALGATAAHALFGRATPVGASRGRPLEGALFSPVVVTAHPSSVLRERDEDARHAAMAALVEDLEVAAALLSSR
jgi:DNA polymerase